MKSEIKLGFQDYTALVFIPDPASTDGSGKTGLVAANLTVSYTRVETDNDVTVTDATGSLNNLAALTTAHTDWGLLEVSSALAPGLYRLDIADAVFAAGAWTAVVYVMITTSAAAASPMEFVLVAFDPLDAIRLGLTSLPNAVAEAVGGLYTRGTGAGQINQAANGMIDTNPVRLNNVSQSLLDLKDLADDGYDPATNKVQGVVLVDTLTAYTGNTPQTGDVFPLASTEIADIKAKTDQLTFTTANKVDSTIQIASDFAQAAADKVWSTATRALTDKAGFSLSTAGIQAIWDALTSALATVGSIGKLLVDNINATISSRASQASADIIDNFVDTEIADIQSRLPATLVGGRMDSNVQAMANDVITAAAVADNAIDAGAIAANAITSAKIATDAIGAAQIAADAIGSSELAATAITEIQTGLSTLTAAQINAEVVDALTVDLIADSYAADGAQPTIAQALLLIQQFLTEKSVSGTTVTVKKPNGSTAAFTLTLDSATAPTSITRAS